MRLRACHKCPVASLVPRPSQLQLLPNSSFYILVATEVIKDWRQEGLGMRPPSSNIIALFPSAPVLHNPPPPPPKTNQKKTRKTGAEKCLGTKLWSIFSTAAPRACTKSFGMSMKPLSPLISKGPGPLDFSYHTMCWEQC